MSKDLNIDELDRIYSLFRFKKLNISTNLICVYSYKGSYFFNADVIPLTDQANYSDILKNLQKMGYACIVRDYKSIHEVKEELFKGFFDYQSSKEHNLTLYRNYCDKVGSIIGGNYLYLSSRYLDFINNTEFNDNVVNKICTNLSQPGPCLVILEAAAGFGKTSTSYEVLKKISNESTENLIPLLAELSRNRQASIFKYVLFDEIDRKFTGINLESVIHFIKSGKIPLIIDGFDELLKNTKDEENVFEDSEPMLETIGELLDENAKILLTTRRTAIFDGDDFNIWIDENFAKKNFSIYRYVLFPPTIDDWISMSRQNLLNKSGLNINNISNPVILSFIRGLDDTEFNKLVTNIDGLINEYINRLLEREKERQNLPVNPDEQLKILEVISSHLVDQDVSSDLKENIEKVLTERLMPLLHDIRSRYSKERPTIEQIVNKFTIHALLDRKGDNDQQIGFINDFVFGILIGNNIINSQKWFGTERFVDYAITAGKTRNALARNDIWSNLNIESLDYLNDFDLKIRSDVYLIGYINRTITDSYIKELDFSETLIGENFSISNTIFTNCNFYNLTLANEVFKDVNFIQCKFYNCSLNINAEPNLYLSGCEEYSSDITEKIYEYYSQIHDQSHRVVTEFDNIYVKHVLEKFWPAGKERFAPNRTENTLKMGVASEELPEIEKAIDFLVKEDFLLKNKGYHSIRLNIFKVAEIKNIIGR